MLKIAICDDDLGFTGSLETMVLEESRSIGIRVDTNVFSDGKTLLKSIQSGERYGLIFIDIEMEQVDGISAARKIRETDRSVLFIYISGYDKYLKELFEVEPFRFLSKPLDKEKFRRYFKEACQRIGETEIFFQFTYNREKSSPNLCVHSSSSYVSPSMLPLSSGDLIEWSLVCHSTLSYQKFCDRHSNHYDHPEELHQSVE